MIASPSQQGDMPPNAGPLKSGPCALNLLFRQIGARHE